MRRALAEALYRCVAALVLCTAAAALGQPRPVTIAPGPGGDAATADPIQIALHPSNFPSLNKAGRLGAVVIPLEPAPAAATQSSPLSPYENAVRLEKSRRFVMSMCMDLQGRLWVGSEEDEIGTGGVQCLDLAAVKDKESALTAWKMYTTKDGLGDNNGYAVACDKQGRIWVGHLNHGVSVFNGQKWQNYEVVGGLSRPDTLSGPLGERIFNIKVCPTDGDVWMATSCGLARYSVSKDAWSYFTRAEGLPSDQASALAFDADGNIYVATQCDGIAMAAASDNYAKWKVVTANDAAFYYPSGDGLCSNLLNDILVTKDGTIYAATDGGLSWSKDKGEHWEFRRGADWAEKVQRAAKGPPAGWTKVAGQTLAEDYCTCLAEGGGNGEGNILVGHRVERLEAVRPLGKSSASRSMPADYIRSILTSNANTLLTASYGNGVGTNEVSPSAFSSNQVSVPVALIPAGAKPPLLEELNKQLQDLSRVGPLDATNEKLIVPLTDDWSTQGAWLGRHGRYFASLAGMVAPLDYIWGPYSQDVSYLRGFGAHHAPDDTLRIWIATLYTDDPRCLEMPPVYLDSRIAQNLTTPTRSRRQSEWDDHGESQGAAFEGPDVCCTIAIPKGLFVLSAYFVNDDGHYNRTRTRDFQLVFEPRTIKQAKETKLADDVVSVACGRVKDFWGGVYKQFLVEGPVEYTLRVKRNYSLNAILSAIMLDQLDERVPPYFMSQHDWEQNQMQQRGQHETYLVQWNKDRRRLEDFGPETSVRESSIKLIDRLEEARDWNPVWWAVNHRRVVAMLRRTFVSLERTVPSPELMEKQATCLFRLGYYLKWETCLEAISIKTPRKTEQSLHWDRNVPNNSGREADVIRAYIGKSERSIPK